MEITRANVLRITVVVLAITILFSLRMARLATVLGFQDPPGNGSVQRDQNFPEQDPSRERDEARDRSNRPPGDADLITLPSGSLIHVRLSDEVNSSHDKAGALYTGTVDPSVLVHDHVVIPRGTEAHIRLVEVKKGGHLHGKAKVRLELVSLIMNGERLGVETDQPSKTQGAAHAKASAEARKAPDGASITTGNPAAFAGPVIAALSAAKVDVKPGSRIEFTLEAPFTFQPPPVQANQP
jgi:hypothetical protein